MKKVLYIFLIFVETLSFANAQDSSKIHFSSSIGILIPLSSFSKSFENSLSLSSGIEYSLKNNYFLLGEIGFNSIKYNQQIKDNTSDFLFQNTNSMLIELGLKIGKNFKIKPIHRFSTSPYLGLAYINFGEPRLVVDLNSKYIKQQINRTQGLSINLGTRVNYKPQVKFIENLFIDLTLFNSNIDLQNSKPQALTFKIGTKAKI